jgi:Na+/H+ antiporter NhaC
VSSEKMWTITVVAALSSLVILAFFLLSPMLSEESTAQRIEHGLGDTIAKFDSIRTNDNSPEIDSDT